MWATYCSWDARAGLEHSSNYSHTAARASVTPVGNPVPTRSQTRMTARRPRARLIRLGSVVLVTVVVALFAASEVDARRGGGAYRGGGRSVGKRTGSSYSRNRPQRSHGATHSRRGGGSTKRSYHGAKTKGRKGERHYTYEANLPSGRKYVGTTSNPKKRFTQHVRGLGAKVTRVNPVRSFVKVWRHSSRAIAKRVERLRYFSLKRRLGAHRVRGAGNTRPFPTDGRNEL